MHFYLIILNACIGRKRIEVVLKIKIIFLVIFIFIHSVCVCVCVQNIEHFTRVRLFTDIFSIIHILKMKTITLKNLQVVSSSSFINHFYVLTRTRICASLAANQTILLMKTTIQTLIDNIMPIDLYAS